MPRPSRGAATAGLRAALEAAEAADVNEATQIDNFRIALADFQRAIGDLPPNLPRDLRAAVDAVLERL